MAPPPVTAPTGQICTAAYLGLPTPTSPPIQIAIMHLKLPKLLRHILLHRPVNPVLLTPSIPQPPPTTPSGPHALPTHIHRPHRSNTANQQHFTPQHNPLPTHHHRADRRRHPPHPHQRLDAHHPRPDPHRPQRRGVLPPRPDPAGLALERQGLFSSSRLGEEDGEHGGIGAGEEEEDEEDPDNLVELLAKLVRDVRAVLLLGGLM